MQRELRQDLRFSDSERRSQLWAQTRTKLRESVGLHVDLALLHSCTFVSFSENCRAHLITLPTHSRWLKARPKTEFHLTVPVFVSISLLSPLCRSLRFVRFRTMKLRKETVQIEKRGARENIAASCHGETVLCRVVSTSHSWQRFRCLLMRELVGSLSFFFCACSLSRRLVVC